MGINRLGILVVLAISLAPLAWGQLGIRQPAHSASGDQKVIISQYLSLDGIGTADSADAIGNYSGAAIDTFYIEPPAGEVWRINRMIVQISDATALLAEKYGAATALTVGVVVKQIDDNGTISTLTGLRPIKNNGDWGGVCYDVQEMLSGTVNKHLGIRWTFGKSGQMIRLDGDVNGKLMVVLNDDFTGLVHQYFLVQGYKETSNQ